MVHTVFAEDAGKNQIDTMKVFAMNTFHYKKQFFALYSNT